MDKDKKKKILTMVLNIVLTLVIIGLTALAIFFIYKNQKDNNSEEKTLTYTELVNEIKNGNVEKIEMTVGSTTLKVKIKEIEEEKTAIIPSTQVFMELVQTKILEDNNIDLQQKQQSILAMLPSYIMSILPTIIMVALFVMIFKMQGLGEKGDVYDNTERKTKITFDDIAGLD